VVKRRFASSSSECGWANDGGAMALGAAAGQLGVQRKGKTPSGPHRPGTQAGTDELERNYFLNLKPDFEFKNQNIQIFLNLI
jgi:hypothetical protein